VSEPQAARSQSKIPAPAKAGAGHFKWVGNTLVLSLLFSTGAMLAAVRNVDVAQARETTERLAYRDGPPFGFSGGFGEDHCQACHNSEKLNATPGSVTISMPERYSPGKAYTVTVTLKRPGMKIGGFVLTSRFENDSAQAGTLSLSDGQQGRIKIAKDRDVQYAYHSRAGTELTGAGVVRWTLRWTAPEGNRVVVFNVASNAANGDDSQSGDFIYTARLRSRGR
jgi:hypothetical protein